MRRSLSAAGLVALMSSLYMVLGCAAPAQRRVTVIVPMAVKIAAEAEPVPVAGPGQIKQPGQRCYSTIQPPDGQACPQSQDTDCLGTNRRIGECMAARWGWFDGPNTGDEWACLDHRITDIENRDWLTAIPGQTIHGPWGIPQANPGTKLAGPNYVEVVGGGYQGDPYDDPYIEIAWMRVYVRGTYGRPCAIPKSGGY